MHIIKFNQSVCPEERTEDRTEADLPAEPARSALYGDRRLFLKSGLAGAFALALAESFSVKEGWAVAPLKIIAFGDSLTAGYNLPADAAFPAVLQKALRADGFSVDIVNAGVSGETAADGLARFDWTFGDGADAAIVELGANDMLRGLDPKQTAVTMENLFGRLKDRHIPFLIAGMLASPSLGEDYKKAFDQIYPALAQKFDAPLYPFFLQGVMGMRQLQLPDGLHPNRDGVERIVANILPAVEGFLKSLPSRS